MNGKPAARISDKVANGAVITGSATVLIGSQGGVACSVCPGGMAIGNPVNPALGAKVLSGTSELDFALPGALPLIWKRHYSSYVNPEYGGACGLLGYGWHLAFDMQLELEESQVLLFDNRGRVICFEEALKPGDSSYSASEDMWLLRGGNLSKEGPRNDTVASWSNDSLFACVPVEWARRDDCIMVISGSTQLVWLFQPFANPLSRAQRWLLKVKRDHFGREQHYAYDDVTDVRHDSTGQETKQTYPWPLLTHITDGTGRHYQLYYRALRPFAWDSGSVRKQAKSGFDPHQSRDSGFKGQAGWQPDSGWRLTRVTVSDERLSQHTLVEYEYSAEGDLIQVKDQYQRVMRRFAYRNHLLVFHQVRQGPEHVYHYEADLPGAKVIEQRNEEGIHYRFTYQEQEEHSITHVADSLGREETYFFAGKAGLKRLVKHRRADGSQIEREYDAFGRMTCSLDPRGRRTYLRRDDMGRLTGIQSASGLASTIRYNASGQILERRHGQRSTRYIYDDWQRVIETVHPDGSRERYEYPDPNQTLLTAEYPIRIEDARQGVKQLSWNIYGQLISYTDCSRRSTRYHYDSDGQLVSVERANGESTRYQRNSYQQIEQVFYADGSGEHYQYDDKGRVAVITPLDSRRSPLTKHRIELRYDLSGRIVARLHAQTALQFAYDPAGRLIVLINENQAVSRFDWSVMDQLVKEVGFDGRTQHYHYNDLGLLVGHDDGGGEHWHHSHYSYDDQDRLSRHQWGSQQNDNLFEQRFFWDEHGHLLHAQQFLGQGEQAQLQTECAFEYDLLGRLVGETQRIWQADAQLAHPELLHEYSLKHELDELGFRERSQLPFAGEVAYMRYGSGHVQGILYNQQSLLDIRRDTLHREVERRWVLTGRPESRELDIAPYGIEAETALSRHQLWDNLGRLQQREYHGLKIADDICTEVNAGDSLDPLINLQKRQYQYDPLGQLVKIHQPRQSQYYAYDLHGRLTAARLGEQGALVQHWQFDWAGNPLPPINTHQPKPQDWSERVMQRWQDSRFNLLGEGERPVSEQVAYWPDNRVFYSADAEYQYDAQGSRIRKTQSGGETHYYYYNDLNQLQRVDCYKKDHGLLRSLYRYDPLGRRLFKQVDRYRPDRPNEIIDSEVEFYGWDGDRLAFRKAAENQWHLIYEPESFTPLLQLQQSVGASANEQDVFMMQMTSALQETLEYLPSHEAYQLARAAREQAIVQLKANGQWQSPELPEKFYFYHCNHMGLPEALTNRHGDILWWATYDAWGNMLEEYNPQDIDQPIRLPGQYHDRETGLYYNRHRYYDPKLGNYINQDPIGLASGEPNLAVYPRNPVQGVDPLGLEEAHQGFMGPWSETRADGNPAGYGCGDSKTDWIVPDRIMGADYFPACRKHDKCYEDLEKTKAQCDLEFKVNLVNTCDNELADKGIRRSLCKGVANIYYKAVDVMGDSAFEAAQGKSTSEREKDFLDLLKDKGVYVDEGYYKEIDARIVAGM